jgi:hypothetical protein
MRQLGRLALEGGFGYADEPVIHFFFSAAFPMATVVPAAAESRTRCAWHLYTGIVALDDTPLLIVFCAARLVLCSVISEYMHAAS